MRRFLVLGVAGLLSLLPQIQGAEARGGFGGGGFHGGGFGGFHGGAGFGGFHGSFARAGFAPGFAGVRPGWHGGGVRWAGGVHPGWGWRTGWHRGWGWRRPWGWAAAGALGFAAYDYGFYDPYGYDCPLVRNVVWTSHGRHVVWSRSCDYGW